MTGKIWRYAIGSVICSIAAGHLLDRALEEWRVRKTLADADKLTENAFKDTVKNALTCDMGHVIRADGTHIDSKAYADHPDTKLPVRDEPQA